MVLIVMLVYTLIAVFYYIKVKKNVKTFKICMVLVSFLAIVQSIYALGFNICFKTDEFIQIFNKIF